MAYTTNFLQPTSTQPTPIQNLPTQFASTQPKSNKGKEVSLKALSSLYNTVQEDYIASLSCLYLILHLHTTTNIYTAYTYKTYT